MHRVRAEDLTVSFEGEAVLIRAVPRGIGAKVPPVAVALLAFHATPKTSEEVIAAFGPRMAPLADGLADAGLLVAPDDAATTPMFFGGFGRVDVHRRMLQDAVRVDTYAAAIQAAVKPGMVVVDAGTGSGVLAVMAAKAGATVYAIDNTDVLDIAKEVVAASGVADKVTLIRGDFSTVEIPQPADIVITETFGALALAEGAARDLQAGCERWLKPGGRVLPGTVDLWFAPIGSQDVFARSVEVFDIKHGVDLRPLRRLATTRGTTLSVTTSELAAPGALAMSLAFPRDEGGKGRISVEVNGPIYGIVGWFSLRFGDDAVLPTGPSDPHTHWRQVVLPWAIPIELSGTLVATITVAPDPSDRRGLEVACEWSCGERSGTTMHRVR